MRWSFACILYRSDYHACAVPGDLTTTVRYPCLLRVMRLSDQVTSWTSWTPGLTSQWPHHGRRNGQRRSRDLTGHPESGGPHWSPDTTLPVKPRAQNWWRSVSIHDHGDCRFVKHQDSIGQAYFTFITAGNLHSPPSAPMVTIRIFSIIIIQH